MLPSVFALIAAKNIAVGAVVFLPRAQGCSQKHFYKCDHICTELQPAGLDLHVWVVGLGLRASVPGLDLCTPLALTDASSRKRGTTCSGRWFGSTRSGPWLGSTLDHCPHFLHVVYMMSAQCYSLKHIWKYDRISATCIVCTGLPPEAYLEIRSYF